MADINLTSGNDTYVQPASDKDVWNNVHGGDGNDTIRLYQGTANGQAGNDRIERIADPDNPNREVQLAFWNAGNNLLVNLAEGWAEDGQGGRDTFIGDFLKVHGSGAQNARVIGNAGDNYYWPNWGTDTFEGGAGIDGVSMNSGHIEFAPGKFRPLVLDEINIVVSADGRRATFTPKVGPSWSTTTLDVEYFDVWSSSMSNTDGRWDSRFVADFITPDTMARETVAAGGSLRWNAASSLGAAATVSFSFVTSAPPSGAGADDLLKPLKTIVNRLKKEKVITAYREDSALFAIRQTPEGKCRYLVGNKCQVYEKRPLVCRAFPLKAGWRHGFCPQNTV